MTTAEIIEEFNKIVNKEQEYTLAELKAILTDIYKVKNGKKVTVKKVKEVKSDEDAPSDEEKPKKRGRPAKEPKLNAKGEEKKKREPSEYNKFIQNKYTEFKLSHPTLSAKEKMLLASSQWNIYKNEIAEAMEAAAK